eukprot:g59030.t1
MADTLDEEVGDAGAHHNLNAEALQPAVATAARRLQKSDVLTLDVGGTIFRTRVETLTTHSGFFKDLLLSEGAIEVNLNQPLFLDLDPEAFKIILHFFLQQIARRAVWVSRLVLPKLSKTQLGQVQMRGKAL